MSNEGQAQKIAKEKAEPSSAIVATEKRRVGRPNGTVSSSGRKQIVDRTRDLMRQKPLSRFLRKEVAEFANVTPALISYYFPEKNDLVLEIATPIVSQYCCDVSIVLRNGQTASVRVKELISKFLEFGLRHGHTMEYFLSAMQSRKGVTDDTMISECNSQINCFMEELALLADRKTLDAEFLHSSIWGQCTYLSSRPHIQALSSSSARLAFREHLTESVFDLLMRGVS